MEMLRREADEDRRRIAKWRVMRQRRIWRSGTHCEDSQLAQWQQVSRCLVLGKAAAGQADRQSSTLVEVEDEVEIEVESGQVHRHGVRVELQPC